MVLGKTRGDAIMILGGGMLVLLRLEVKTVTSGGKEGVLEKEEELVGNDGAITEAVAGLNENNGLGQK